MRAESVGALKMSNPTKKEKEYWGKICKIGCIVCLKNGIYSPYVSVHHINGRTKRGAHMNVLPLCFSHHMGGTKENPSIHPWKARFIRLHGTQESLKTMVDNLLDGIA